MARRGLEDWRIIWRGFHTSLFAASIVVGVAAAPAPPETVEHVVKTGERVWSIARLYGVDAQAIIAQNQLPAPYIVAPGLRLRIPLGAKAAKSATLVKTAQSQPLRAAAPAKSAPAPVAPAKPAASAAAPAAVPVAPRVVRIVIGVKDGKRYVGDVLATIAPDGSVAVDSDQMLELLKPLLKTTRLGAIAEAIKARKEATVADLAKGGLNAQYDAGLLQVVLEILPQDRPLQELQIAALDRSLIGDVALPGAVSAYLNLRGSVDYVERGGQTGIRQPQLLLDGAVRVLGPVVEGEAQFAPDAIEKLTRQGTRLVYDEMSSLTRWTLGDLRVQTEGFQGSREMAGLSVMRLYDQLSPQLNVRPRGNRSFTLAQASTVQTYINGQPVQQVRLEPGTYNAANFPFVEGANDINLVITSDAGAVENVKFSIFFDRALLEPGLSEFGAFAGFASDISNANLTYNYPKPLISGFFRHGFDDVLTAGINFQADSKVQMAGLAGLYGSPFGTLGFDLSGSRDKYAGEGYALNLGFNRLFQDTGNFHSQSLAVTFQTRSKNFSIISATDNVPVLNPATLRPNNPYRYEAGATYSYSFGEYTFAQLDGRYAKAFGNGEDIGSVRGSFGYGFSQNFNVNVGVQYTSGGFLHGVAANIQLTYRFDDRSNIRGEYQTQTNMRRLSYQNSRGRGTGAWNVSADLEDIPGSANFNGSIDYAANRAEVGAAQTATYDMHGRGATDVRSTVRMGTSVAMADGNVGVGRPIYDSFALFKKHTSLKDAEVVVDPSVDGEQARTDLLGSALLSDMGSHSLRSVTYDVPDAPAGYDLGSGSFRALPPYKSGYTVTVGSDYAMSVWGRLLDAKGDPIPLLAGRAIELAKDGRSVTLFTSRDGRFSAQGLRPGVWRIEMPSEPPVAYVITIEQGTATSLVKLGDLRPSPEEAK